eukprot:Phypoly_transcript_14479.p1 GENE.Phypoly_transcript_14479~~Phypoly_transcript_14479.p1  ORF type:complete len:109 (+),score=18.32 Phypoly_transcript_14479:384-710(+)
MQVTPSNTSTNTNGNSNDPQTIFEGLSTEQSNAKMRERMLSFWLAAIGHPVVLKMQENTTVTGVLTGITSNQSMLHLSQLATPIYVYPEAVVRVDDVLDLEVLPKPKE